MIQIFYKDKPIIISDKKSDLKEALLIDLKIIKSVDILKLLRKKKVFSIKQVDNSSEFLFFTNGIQTPKKKIV